MGVRKMENKFLNKMIWEAKLKKYGPAILLAINVGYLIFYIFGGSGYKNSFHSDSATKVLLAQEIYETGKFFPASWNYVNADIWILFGHIFVIPLLFFIQPGYLVYSISGLISAFLLLIICWKFSEKFEVSRSQRLCFLAAVASGFSGSFAENLFGQVSYGVLVILMLAEILIIENLLNSIKSQKRFLFAVGLLIAITAASNAGRSFIVFILPLLGGFSLCLLRKKTQAERLINPLIAISVGFGVGIGFHFYLLSFLQNVQGAGDAKWVSFDAMIKNCVFSLNGTMGLLGAIPTAGQKITNIRSVYEACRLIAGISSIILFFHILIIQIKNNKNQFFLGFLLTSLFLSYFLYITTSLLIQTAPLQTARYLVPSVFAGICLLLLTPVNKLSLLMRTILSFVMINFFISAPFAYIYSNLSSEFKGGQSGQFGEQRELAKFLQSRKLEYGYASFWNAGIISVLTSGDVRVRQVLFNDGIPLPHRHLSSDRWYNSGYYKGQTFLILNSAEEKVINFEKIEDFGIKILEKINFKNFAIYVFDANLADKLPGWDTNFQKPLIIPINKYSKKHIGKYEQNYLYKGPALVADEGQIGCLHYGPFIEIPPGNYEAVFTFDPPDKSSKKDIGLIASIDVASSPDQKIFASKDLGQYEKDATFKFSTAKKRVFEFRVFTKGTQRLVLRSLKIYNAQKVKEENQTL
jgi:hypothetical protein